MEDGPQKQAIYIDFPLKSAGSFHSDVAVCLPEDQSRKNPMIFPWFSHGFGTRPIPASTSSTFRNIPRRWELLGIKSVLLIRIKYSIEIQLAKLLIIWDYMNMDIYIYVYVYIYMLYRYMGYSGSKWMGVLNVSPFTNGQKKAL